MRSSRETLESFFGSHRDFFCLFEKSKRGERLKRDVGECPFLILGICWFFTMCFFNFCFFVDVSMDHWLRGIIEDRDPCVFQLGSLINLN